MVETGCAAASAKRRSWSWVTSMASIKIGLAEEILQFLFGGSLMNQMEGHGGDRMRGRERQTAFMVMGDVDGVDQDRARRGDLAIPFRWFPHEPNGGPWWRPDARPRAPNGVHGHG